MGRKRKIDVKLAQSLRKEGYSMEEIAQVFGVKRQSVWKALKEPKKGSTELESRLLQLIQRCVEGDLSNKAFKGRRFATDYLIPLVGL